jgi:hypothetical protein
VVPASLTVVFFVQYVRKSAVAAKKNMSTKEMLKNDGRGVFSK